MDPIRVRIITQKELQDSGAGHIFIAAVRLISWEGNPTDEIWCQDDFYSYLTEEEFRAGVAHEEGHINLGHLNASNMDAERNVCVILGKLHSSETEADDYAVNEVGIDTYINFLIKCHHYIFLIGGFEAGKREVLQRIDRLYKIHKPIKRKSLLDRILLR